MRRPHLTSAAATHKWLRCLLQALTYIQPSRLVWDNKKPDGDEFSDSLARREYHVRMARQKNQRAASLAMSAISQSSALLREVESVLRFGKGPYRYRDVRAECLQLCHCPNQAPGGSNPGHRGHVARCESALRTMHYLAAPRARALEGLGPRISRLSFGKSLTLISCHLYYLSGHQT